MKRSIILSTALIIAANPASASTTLPAVQANTSDIARYGLALACDAPEASNKQLQHLLGRHEPSEARALRRELEAVVAEACAEGQPTIVVNRSGLRLDWTPTAHASPHLSR
jgi:hypothetical protein